MVTTDQHIDEKLAIDSINFANNLSANEVSKIKALIIDYHDIFPSNPEKPKRTELIKHQIITNDSLPFSNKPRRIPAAWKEDIDQQVSKMLTNDIIRPSYSPWNAPVILLKKRQTIAIVLYLTSAA